MGYGQVVARTETRTSCRWTLSFDKRMEGDEARKVPGLVNVQKAIENGHRNSEFSH